jgi:hypothetical protein
METKENCDNAVTAAKKLLKAGDRIGCIKCPNTKRVFTFSHWDGNWMVSKTGIDDYHPINIYSVNGKKVNFKL